MALHNWKWRAFHFLMQTPEKVWDNLHVRPWFTYQLISSNSFFRILLNLLQCLHRLCKQEVTPFWFVLDSRKTTSTFIGCFTDVYTRLKTAGSCPSFIMSENHDDQWWRYDGSAHQRISITNDVFYLLPICLLEVFTSTTSKNNHASFKWTLRPAYRPAQFKTKAKYYLDNYFRQSTKPGLCIEHFLSIKAGL